MCVGVSCVATSPRYEQGGAHVPNEWLQKPACRGHVNLYVDEPVYIIEGYKGDI